MQKLIVLGVVAVTLFALSAGTSIYLRRTEEAAPEQPVDTPAIRKGNPAQAHTPGGQAAEAGNTGSPLKPAVRPPYNPEAESAAQLAANLNKQTEALKSREQALAARQKSVELAYQDVRHERAGLDELRKKLAQEMAALEAKLATLEQSSGELDQKQQKTSKQLDELKNSTFAFEGQEQERLKHLATVYDAMAPAGAAKILQQMADSGGLETAAKVLSLMKERQAAKVIAELPDAVVAAQLMEKLKTLQKPAAPVKKPN